MNPIGESGRAAYTRHSAALVWYWTIFRKDGAQFRFVAHDQFSSRQGIPLSSPEPGILTFATRHEVGLSDGSTQLGGIIESGTSILAGIPFADFHARKLRGATAVQQLASWEYNWMGGPVIAHTWDVGDVTFNEFVWSMELVGLTGRLKQKRGAIVTRQCINELGKNDGIRTFCQASIAGWPQTITACAVPGTLSPSRRTFHLKKTGGTGLTSSLHATPNWFAFGNVVCTSGQNVGLSEIVESSSQFSADTQLITLQNPLPFSVLVGDVFTLQVGCDKQLIETCQPKFSAQGSFRGAADIPGFDVILRTPSGS